MEFYGFEAVGVSNQPLEGNYQLDTVVWMIFTLLESSGVQNVEGRL